MPQYMVERHLPGITPEQLATAAGRAKSVTAEMTGQGKPVRYLRSTFLPSEEGLLPVRCSFGRACQRSQRARTDSATAYCRSKAHSRGRRGLRFLQGRRSSPDAGPFATYRRPWPSSATMPFSMSRNWQCDSNQTASGAARTKIGSNAARKPSSFTARTLPMMAVELILTFSELP